jgi:N-acetyl-alpha-D-glucosaminyl L-malate synthase BshA
MLAKRRHLPFVTTLHGTDITLVGLDRSYLPITRFGIEESDGVTSISGYLREKTVQDFGITRPIEVIYNFVNCDEYKPLGDEREAARARFAPPGEKILIHLSNFRPVKRILDAIEVFARVAKEIPSHLLMVGDGPDRSSAEWLVNSKGLQNRVHFLGKQDRVHELLPVADLMLMPSQLESFGLAALEAMACKVPTIATRVGGVPELIEDGVTGRLYAVGDVDAMAEGAIELLSDSKRLTAMADAGRKAAQDQYCASRIIPVYEKYYESVLARADV